MKFADSVYICGVNFINHLIKSFMKNFFKKNWAKIVAFVCGAVLACLGKLDVTQLVGLLV